MVTVRFYDKRHRRALACALKQTASNDPRVVSTLYLLTADPDVWEKMKPRIKQESIDFEQVRFDSLSEDGYALYSAAKDIYLGTKVLCLADLSDREMVRSKVYWTICTGMMLRRGMIKIQ